MQHGFGMQEDSVLSHLSMINGQLGVALLLHTYLRMVGMDI